MNTIFKFIFESVVNMIEVSLFFYLIWRQLTPKSRYKDKMAYVVPVSAILMFSVAVFLNTFKLNGTVGTIIFLIMQLLFAFTFISGSVAECFFWPVYFILSDLAAEGLSFLISGGFTSTGPNGLVHEYPQRYVLVTLYILILSLFTIIIVKISNKKMKLPNTMVPVLMFVAFTSLISIGLLLDVGIRLNLQPNDFQLRLIYSVVVIIIFFIAFTMILFMFAGRMYQDKIELAQENILKESKYEELKYLLKSMSGTINYQIIENRSPYVIKLQEVRYFESEKRAVAVHMKNGEIHTFYKNMDELYQEVNSLYPLLVRVNRSFIVNINIAERKNKIAYFDGIQTRISDKYLDNFKEMYKLKELVVTL